MKYQEPVLIDEHTNCNLKFHSDYGFQVHVINGAKFSDTQHITNYSSKYNPHLALELYKMEIDGS